MATTPELALPYPIGTDAAEVHTWTQSLAQRIEDVLTKDIQTGVVSVTGNGTNENYATVVFAHPFATVPRVIASSNRLSNYATVRSVTTTGCEIWITVRNNQTWTTTKDANWIATVL